MQGGTISLDCSACMSTQQIRGNVWIANVSRVHLRMCQGRMKTYKGSGRGEAGWQKVSSWDADAWEYFACRFTGSRCKAKSEPRKECVTENAKEDESMQCLVRPDMHV